MMNVTLQFFCTAKVCRKKTCKIWDCHSGIPEGRFGSSSVGLRAYVEGERGAQGFGRET
jgi:hypothetical protein